MLDAAAARMEQYHGDKPISKLVGRALGRIANEAIADLGLARMIHALPKSTCNEQTICWSKLRCDELAYRNRLTLFSYEQRLSRFGKRDHFNTCGSESRSDLRSEKLQLDIAAHRRAKIGQRTEQLYRTDSARPHSCDGLRLPLPSATSFSEMANVYRKGELAFVDWATESICRGRGMLPT